MNDSRNDATSQNVDNTDAKERRIELAEQTALAELRRTKPEIKAPVMLSEVKGCDLFSDHGET